jgi:hypothetical protein
MGMPLEQYQSLMARMAARTGQAQPSGIPSPQPAEADLHQAILDYCARERWYALHSRMDKPTTLNVAAPDFVLFLPAGRTLLIECKRPESKLRPDQLATKVWLEQLGHTVHVVHTETEFHAAIRSITSQPSNAG